MVATFNTPKMALHRFQESRTRLHLPCEICGNPTGENKPYCSAHIDRFPYIAALIKQVESLEQEQKLAKEAAITGGKFRINKNSIILEEILNHVKQYGPKTIERLARELNISKKVIEVYVKSLKRRGLVIMGMTLRRKSIVIARIKESPVVEDGPVVQTSDEEISVTQTFSEQQTA